MNSNRIVLALFCTVLLGLSGCSRQQSDWQKARETNTTDSYEQFLKKYSSGEFTAQAQARVKELYEERDWQKARDADTPEAYQAFLKQYADGKWTEEARIRVENFTLAQAPGSTTQPSASADAGAALPPSADTMAAPPPASPASPTPPVAAAKAPVHLPPPRASAALPAKLATKGGSFSIQLGAFKSGAPAAHERWLQLQKKYPSLLAGLTSKVSKKSMSGDSGSLYRLQATSLTEKRARDICASLLAKSQACVVVVPSQP